jgi:hypothetical protein
MNGHGLDAHFLARPDDAEGYLTPVGYQYFLEHKNTSCVHLKLATYSVTKQILRKMAGKLLVTSYGYEARIVKRILGNRNAKRPNDVTAGRNGRRHRYRILAVPACPALDASASNGACPGRDLK